MCPQETDPSFDFEPEVVLLDTAAEVQDLDRLSFCFCPAASITRGGAAGIWSHVRRYHHCLRRRFRHREPCRFEYSHDGSHHFIVFEVVLASSAYNMPHSALGTHVEGASFGSHHIPVKVN